MLSVTIGRILFIRNLILQKIRNGVALQKHFLVEIANEIWFYIVLCLVEQNQKQNNETLDKHPSIWFRFAQWPKIKSDGILTNLFESILSSFSFLILNLQTNVNYPAGTSVSSERNESFQGINLFFYSSKCILFYRCGAWN